MLWSRSNLDRLRFWLPAPAPSYRLRLPAPAPNNTIFVTQVQIKNAVLKTKFNNLVFFKVYRYLFFLSICVKIVEMWQNFTRIVATLHHSTPKLNSNSPEPELFSPTPASAKKSVYWTQIKGYVYFFPCLFFPHIYVITVLLYVVAGDFSPSGARTLVLSKGM